MRSTDLICMSLGESNAQAPIEEELSARLLEHKGRWVAVDQNEIVAVGDSVAEVLAAAREAGHTDPLVFRVSASPERLAFF